MSKTKDTIKVSKQFCRAAIDSNSFNKEDNTIEAVFATATPVRRFDWMQDRMYNEVLDISNKAIDFTRLRNGAPVLNTHNTYGVENVIGVVTDASVVGNEARATIKLSDEDVDAPIINKIRKGVIRNISVGYIVNEYTISGEENTNDLPTYTATRWQPTEISFVPVPADQNAGVRNAENQDYNIAKIVNPIIMEENQDVQTQERAPQPQPQQAVPAPAPMQVDEATVRKEAIQQERKRVADITATCITAGLPSEFAQSLISEGKNINDARAAIIDEVAKRANPAPTSQGAKVTGEDEKVHTRQAIVEGIMSRAIPGSVDLKGNEKATRFRNMRLLDIAKERLQAAGENFSMLNEQEVVKRAWATTDYPDLLSTTFMRTLRQYYEGIVDDWQFLARQESVVDFREKTGIKVDGLVSFEEIPEGGEYKESPIIQSEKATIKLKKYGRRYAISDIAIINDDLSVFSRVPQYMAQGAQQFQSDMVWALITGNKNAPDGVAMFNASHKNYDGTGAAIAEASLTAARVAMRRQLSPAGQKLNIKPAMLLVPPELQTAAEKMVTSVLSTTVSDVNVFAGTLKVVVSNQLTDAKAWYLLADPAAVSVDGVIYAYLNGQPGLRTESRINWETDAMEVKASMAFAATIWGWQGWYKNKGA